MLSYIWSFIRNNYFLYFYYGKIRRHLQYYASNPPEFCADEILPNIYLGNIQSAYQKEFLKEKGITHIITAVLGVSPIFPDDFTYLNINSIDYDNDNLMTNFNKTNDFINKCIEKNGKVLIHCICGVSRSVTITCAYLMKNKNINPNEAIEFIKEKRPIAEPNCGFKKQLNNYYEMLRAEKISIQHIDDTLLLTNPDNNQINQ